MNEILTVFIIQEQMWRLTAGIFHLFSDTIAGFEAIQNPFLIVLV